MDARSLLPLFDTVHVLALAAWAGSLLALTFGVAPILPKALDPPSALRLARALLPRCYVGCALSGAVALPSYVAVPLCFPELRGPTVAAHSLLIVGGIGLMLYGGNALGPSRDSTPERPGVLTTLLRRAALLNGITLAIIAALLVAFAVRPKPTTSGLVDRSPEDWARQSYEAFEAKRRAYEQQQPRAPATLPPGRPAP